MIYRDHHYESTCQYLEWVSDVLGGLLLIFFNFFIGGGRCEARNLR